MKNKVFYFKLIICFGSFFFFGKGSSVFGQNKSFAQEDITRKYWHYKNRFLGLDNQGGFIKIGLGQGMSLPASGRNFSLDCEYFWLISLAKCTSKPGHKGLMSWGDATYYLGYYILNLSLEYYNLLQAGKNTNATVQELFYALKAYERLDKGAEVALGLGEGKLNGFFLRDDVPQNFFEINPAMNEKEKMFYACVHSDFSCHKVNTVNSGAYVSQDQIIALMLGFAGVVEFASTASIMHENERIELKDLAQLYTHKMVSYLIDCKWQLKAPNGEKIGDKWGGNVLAFNHNIATIAERICGTRFQPTYQAGWSKITGKVAKGSFNWGWNLQAKHNKAMIFVLSALSRDWDLEKANKRALDANQQIYGLMYAAFNKGEFKDKEKEQKYWEEFLSSAPIDGPCHDSPNCNAPLGWRSFDRWWHEEQKDGNTYGLPFEFTGLDYMLAYNLYYYCFLQHIK